MVLLSRVFTNCLTYFPERSLRLDVVRAAKEKKIERQQEAARIRAKEKKKLNVVTPPRMNKGPKGKRGRPPKAALAQPAVPVAKKSVAPPPPAPLVGPNNMEVFPSASEEGQPAVVAATKCYQETQLFKIVFQQVT